jgi:hypothetical protein
MNSMSFGELYIFRDYSGKLRRMILEGSRRPPELNRSGLEENTHLQGTRGPRVKA